jgi:hypothetical protein
MRPLYDYSLEYTLEKFIEETQSNKKEGKVIKEGKIKSKKDDKDKKEDGNKDKKDGEDENKDKKDQNFQPELYIHNLMWQVLSHNTLNTHWHATHERGSKESNYENKKEKAKAKNNEDSKKNNPGYFIDFLLSPKWATDKVIYLLELKVEPKDKEEGLLYYSLFGLKQIFEKDYHRDIRPFRDTEAIISIGIAADTTHASFSILKIPVLGGKYGRLGKLICQSFYIFKGADNSTKVRHTEQEEFTLNLSKTDDAAGGGGSRAGCVSNDDIKNDIAQQLETIMNHIS